MKNFIFIILTFNFIQIVFAEEIIWETYGTRKVIKNLQLEKDSWIYTISNDFIFTTNVGTYGTGVCTGSVNKEKDNEDYSFYLDAKVYCEAIDQNEQKAILDFSYKRKAESVEGVSKFTIKGGTGPYLGLKNNLCVGAFLKLRNNKFIWKGKCQISEKAKKAFLN